MARASAFWLNSSGIRNSSSKISPAWGLWSGSSMIVDDLDIPGSAFLPSKNDPPLIVDPYRVSVAVCSLELLKTIARWVPEVVNRYCPVEHAKLHQCLVLDIRRK